MVKVLAIGNSFSEDATYYLHDMAKAIGEAIQVVNLYIGGCSLEWHWQNIERGEQAYQYQINGEKTEKYVSINETLASNPWDYIVIQQSSSDSGWENTYEPFMGLIVDYLKKEVPQAEILLHKTWAYDINSAHKNFMRYNRSQKEMYERLNQCYTSMSKKYDLKMIPCADVIQDLRKLKMFDLNQGGMSLCRDGYHMHYIYGRYVLAYTWAHVLLGKSLQDSTYRPQTEFLPNEVANEEILKIIRSSIETTFNKLEYVSELHKRKL